MGEGFDCSQTNFNFWRLKLVVLRINKVLNLEVHECEWSVITVLSKSLTCNTTIRKIAAVYAKCNF